MTVTPTVTPTSQQPSHHITLEEKSGANKTGLLVIGNNNQPNPLAITRSAYPRTSTRISQGAGKYDDFELPYKSIAQDDWSGGRGAETFEDDVTQYLDGYRVNTEHEGQVTLQPAEQWSSGYRNANLADSAGALTTFQALTGNYRYLASNFTAADDYTIGAVYVYIKQGATASTTNLNCAIYSVSGGEPDTLLSSTALTPANHQAAGEASLLHKFEFSQAVTNGTEYQLVLWTGAGGTGWWEVLTAGLGLDSFSSADGVSWAAHSVDIHYAIIDNEADHTGIFFEYRDALYYVKNPASGGNSTLYINGDRGVADSNSGDKSKLNDGTKSWVTNEHAGAVAVIIKGPGSAEDQPWRTISSNTSTALTVSPDWNIAHTTATEYVIIASSKWTSLGSLSGAVTDVAATDKFCYFARGDSTAILRYQAYNNGGTHTVRSAADAVYGTFIKIIEQPDDKTVAWVGAKQDIYDTLESVVIKAYVPFFWGDLYSPIRTLFDTTKPFDGLDVTNVTHTAELGQTKIDIAAGFTTGILGSVAVDNLDILDGNKIRLNMVSSVNASAGDLKLCLSENNLLEETRSPMGVWLSDLGRSATAVTFYDGTDYLDAYNATQAEQRHRAAFTLLSSPQCYLYIGFAAPVSGVKLALASTNNNAETMSVDYWEGDAGWVSVASLSDGTVVSSATLGQTGYVTWTFPTDHERGSDITDLSDSLYWYRLSASGDLDEVSIANACGHDSASNLLASTTSVTNLHDGRTGARYRQKMDIAGSTRDSRLVVMSSKRFNQVDVTMGGTVNAVAATMTGEYWNGQAWTSLSITDNTVTASATLAKTGTVTFDIPLDWATLEYQEESGYIVVLSFSANLTEQVEISELTCTRNDYTALSIPALTAATWARVELDLDLDITDMRTLGCIGLRLDTDLGAQYVQLYDDIVLTGIPNIPNGGRIPLPDKLTGMVVYGSDRANPWVFTQSRPYEIQTQNSDVLIPIPLAELDALVSPQNGRASCQNGAYLYFNIGRRLQRYLDRTLENIGPDAGEGLPENRQGEIAALLSYPGRVYVGVDAGASGFSSVLARKGGGYHELYRAPYGDSLRVMFVQSIPGEAADRYWVQVGNNILWLTLPSSTFNPLNDTSMVYTHEGYLVTGWISAGFLDIAKLYATLKLYTENLSATNYEISVEYQTESGTLDGTWTGITDDFDASPFEEHDIAANYVTARRLRFRIRLRKVGAAAQGVTPVLKALVLEALLKFPVKRAFTMRVLIDDYPADLTGQPNRSTKASDTFAVLEAWHGTPTPLVWRNWYAPYDNVDVVLEPLGSAPIERVMTAENREIHVAEITLLEI
jgi:hypothetical protein